MNKVNWIKVYFSPFKFFWPKLYIGKVAIGTPIFLPKKKIGFDFVKLGWKTKWGQYRHQWNPIWSFVFFKWQIALIFEPKYDMHYWECWLYYTKTASLVQDIKQRLKIAKEKYPCIWIKGVGVDDEKICYWDHILKKKYLYEK